MKSLIAWYSRSGENLVGGQIGRLAVGNTEVLAGHLQQLTNANLFRIVPLVPYSEDYCRCIDQACQDLRRNARPALRGWPGAMDAYDRVYLGYPNYWGTLPMPVFTFLEGVCLKGKTVCPFTTYENSRPCRSVQDLRRLCPESALMPELAVHGSEARWAQEAVQRWLEEIDEAVGGTEKG